MAPPTVSPVPFSPPDVGPAEYDAVRAVLESGWLSTGPRVQQFERAFASYTGAAHALALNSGTAALHLSLIASHVGPGHEVITTPLTFCATANVAVHVGARPVFADIDPATWNLDPAATNAAVTSATRAIIPVHYGGRPADMAGFEAIARPRGIALIEDAAHCVEGVDGRGRKVGAIGDFTCFSFYATKNLTTGEGGMVTTHDAAADTLMRMASLHGMDRAGWARAATDGRSGYDVRIAGFKYNMMDLQAAIGLHQLERITAMHRRRVALRARYDAGLASLPLVRTAASVGAMVHACHLYPVLVDPARAGVTRDVLQERLRHRGVATSVHFKAVHLHSFYQERYGFTRGMLPHAERVADQTLSLPFSSSLRDDQVDYVIDALRACLPRES